MSTIFTKIIKGEIPSFKIAEDENYIAILDVFPLKRGHALVIPKIENDYIFDLDDDRLAGLMVFAKKVAIGIQQSIPCKRIGIAVIGLEVPHTHIHLIPMENVSDMNFSNPKLKLPAEEMQKIADLISAEINS